MVVKYENKAGWQQNASIYFEFTR